MPFGERRCVGEGRGGVDLGDLSLNVGMSLGPVVDVFCGAREALWRRRAVLWRYVTDVMARPTCDAEGVIALRCLADGGGAIRDKNSLDRKLLKCPVDRQDTARPCAHHRR